jgi:DNA-directed RNA polymerase subunit RPC12/RpoP
MSDQEDPVRDLRNVAEIQAFGVEPDFTRNMYDPNTCSWCGQPVLIIASKERVKGYRTDQTSCEYCMSKLTKRTRSKEFEWVFLKGWKPS